MERDEIEDLADDEPVSLVSQSTDKEEEPISLVETDRKSPPGVHAFGSGIGKEEKRQDFKRPLNVTGQGATRCRIFHSKIADASLKYMQKQINEWIDSDQIEAKHVGHVIGVMEGKIAEPNMIVMVWY